MIQECSRCGHDRSVHLDTGLWGACTVDDCGCRNFIDSLREDADRLAQMWSQQHSFMKLLQEKRGFPEFPVDVTSKPGQKLVKSLMHECMDELHESLQHLKNSKDHRATEVTNFDREEFVEELCDSLHYFIEIAIVSGVGLEELFDAYIKKGKTNRKRILDGY